MQPLVGFDAGTRSVANIYYSGSLCLYCKLCIVIDLGVFVCVCGPFVLNSLLICITEMVWQFDEFRGKYGSLMKENADARIVISSEYLDEVNVCNSLLFLFMVNRKL
jgi:hypothetical protein